MNIQIVSFKKALFRFITRKVCKKSIIYEISGTVITTVIITSLSATSGNTRIWEYAFLTIVDSHLKIYWRIFNSSCNQ